MKGPVVCNASPLIAFHQIGRLDILESIFGVLRVPAGFDASRISHPPDSPETGPARLVGIRLSAIASHALGYNAPMAQFNTPAYDVKKPTGRCALTGRDFTPGETYIATLIEEGDELKRVDLSLDAWNEGKRPGQLFSHWRAVAPEPNQKKKLVLDDEVLMNLLERLADTDQPQRIAFRFVLMLVLMRKKLLRYDRTESESGDVVPDRWVVTPKLDLAKGPLGKWDESRTFEVIDPHLDEQGVRAVTDQLGEILQAEL
jgi:hypothetical protein